MRPLRYSLNVTLDGCVDHTVGIADEDLHLNAAETLARADAFLFGRITWEMMGFWRTPSPDWPEWMQVFARTLGAGKKYVFSRTLQSVDWGSELVRGDLEKTVRELKAQPGRGLLAGGTQLGRQLAELGLIDEYEFVIHPRIIGRGPTLFAGLRTPVDLELIGQKPLRSGAVVMRYALKRPAGDAAP